MQDQIVPEISSYHAHVYYNADSKPTAAELRAAIEREFMVTVGRWHDQPVGPHPCGSYQIMFDPSQFGDLVPWLAFNRAGLTVLVHPNTGANLPDHTDYAIWLGKQYDLKTEVLP